jgi:probable FeS assembly SUF system protein SufT
VTFSRDTKAVVIPDGIDITVPEGATGLIIQRLGDWYTVRLDVGYLVRIDDADADAIGKQPVVAERQTEADPDAVVTEEQVWEELKSCYDPEIPVNIVELGLVYKCHVDRAAEGSRVDIEMTLTAPGCGMGQVLTDDVEAKVRRIPGVSDVRVELVFDPPWSPDHMSEAARLELGFF